MLKRIAGFIRRHDWFAVAVEIGVVVIGLLLAFQLDRWREARVDRQQESVYIDRLVADVQSDVPEIEYAIELQKLRLELVDLLLRVVEAPEAALESPALFMGAVSQAAYTYTPVLTSHTFQNLESTGDFRLIRTDELKVMLFDYYGFDETQRQYRPLQFATEHRHFELAAGVLSLEQERYTADQWLFFRPQTVDSARADRPDIEGILEAANRLGERPDLVAWLPYVRQMQLEQIAVHQMRLERATTVLDKLREYAVEIGPGG